MEPHDLERITRLALRELGAGDVPVTIEADRQPDRSRRLKVANRRDAFVR